MDDRRSRAAHQRQPARRPVYELIDEKAQQICNIAAEHGATRVRVVGSVGSADGRFDDAIDLLVAWRAGTSTSDQAAFSARVRGLLEREAGIAGHDGSEGAEVIAYYREIVRPRVLRTAPLAGTTDPACELHVLTCRDDWLNLIWVLKTFYHFSQRRYALCIHDDGTVPAEGLEHLRRHFPDARLIQRGEADVKVEPALRDYPRCLEFRRRHPLAPKVFDFSAFLQSDRMLLFDSDLLFFGEPRVLLERIEDPAYRRNVFNAGRENGYTVHPDAVRRQLGCELLPFINAGLGLVHRGSLRVDWCEEFLGLPGLTGGPAWWNEEQTLIALCSSRFGAELLPEEYTVSLDAGIAGRPVRHYLGRIRQRLMYSEGIRALEERHFLPWRFVILLESGGL